MKDERAFDRGADSGRRFAQAYRGDVHDLKPIANGEPVYDRALIEELAQAFPGEVDDGPDSSEWAGFRAGIASVLVEHGIVASSGDEHIPG